ncbi:MAG: glycosyltransferase family 39 protein [Planctomycetes bacterium]|nr:glycosyltransferase family 39 protein [Planctomycetota bacterium]
MDAERPIDGAASARDVLERDPSGRTPAAAWVLLAVMTLLAAWARFDGIERLLPQSPEPDDHAVIQLVELEAGTPEGARPAVFGRYPLLLARLGTLAPRAVDVEHANTLDEFLIAAAEPTLRLRLLVACFAVLAIPLSFLLARHFLDPWPALLAAAFTATSLIHLMFSQQARPHAVHFTLLLLALIASLALVERPSVARSLCAGACSGLAFATLQTGGFTLAPLVVAHVFAPKAWNARSRWLAACSSLAVAAAIAAAFVPGGRVPDPGATTAEMNLDGTVVSQGGLMFELVKLNGLGFPRGFRQVFVHDPVPLLLGCVGLVLLLFRLRRVVRDRRVLVLAAYSLPYGLVWGMYAWVYERYWLPLYPAMTMLAAWAVWRASRGAGGELAWRRLFVVFAALALAFPVAVQGRFVLLAAAPDTVHEAADWLVEHAQPGDDVLVTPQLNLPLAYSNADDALLAETKRAQAWRGLQRARPLPAALGPRLRIRNVPTAAVNEGPERAPANAERLLTDPKPRFVVIEATRWNRWILLSSLLWRGAVERGDPVFASQGDDDGTRSSFYQDVPAPIPRLFALDRMGPRIEIYTLR